MTNDETIPEEPTLESSDDPLEETLKKRLELELGLPLTPKPIKKIEPEFEGSVILLENFPVESITNLKIDNKCFSEEDFVLSKSDGIVYLKANQQGFLEVNYDYCLPEADWKPLLDLMIEYETDTRWDKNASSIKENNVTVSYDTSVGKGVLIQGMIQDLKNRYHCVVEMI